MSEKRTFREAVERHKGPLACSALVNGRCRNGFPVNGSCDPIADRHAKTAYGIPLCLSESYCGRIYDSTGGAPPMPAWAVTDLMRDER